MMAAMFGRADLADLLLDRGADLHARDAAGLGIPDAARLMGATDLAAALQARLDTRTP
jgi:ankyrin repeat protein